MIELHSLFHAGIVSQRRIGLDQIGLPISLEDLSYDEPYAEPVYVATVEQDYSGGFDPAYLGLATILLWVKVLRQHNHTRRLRAEAGGVNRQRA